MAGYIVQSSQWGFTAYLQPSNREVAHSPDKELLEAYLGDVGGEPEPTALTEVTYTTKARSTGATCSAGRTDDGWGVVCDTHGGSAPAKNRSTAETIVSRPQEWCADCTAIKAAKDLL